MSTSMPAKFSAVHDTPNPANCSRLPGDGRHYAAAAPASVPPSDADLLDVQRPHRRTDSADFRPRKQKESNAYSVVSAKAQVLVLGPEPAQYMAVKDRQAETTG